jgi:hypothetical protein
MHYAVVRQQRRGRDLQGRRFASGLFPFVPIIIGAALKFALIDVVGSDPLTHFVEIYFAPGMD